MKRTLAFLLAIVLMLTLAACGSQAEPGGAGSDPALEETTPISAPPETPPGLPEDTASPEEAAPPEDETPAETSTSGKNILIAYFSATNNTQNIADHLHDILDADLYKIEPETPYTSDDLNYKTDCRANREQNDAGARPAISGSVDSMEQYDVIFLGYPIWWGAAPKIIYTFLESYDLSGKTIVPFCTSGSSGIGSSAKNLQELADDVTWLEGRRFSGSASADEVQSWVDSLELTLTPAA